MKKNILIKTLSSLAALTSLGGLSATLTSCGNVKAVITINNKVTELYWLDQTYHLDVTFKNQGDAELLFSSSDEAVATIDAQGYVRAHNNGTTTIRAYSSLDANVFDEFKLSVNELWVKGVVTDTNNQPLSGVIISYDGNSITTDETGHYFIKLEKAGSVLYFEKLGYIGQAFGNSYALTSQEHELNVKLTPYSLGRDVTVKGKVTNKANQPVANCSITFNRESKWHMYRTDTNADGSYEIAMRVDPNNPQVSFITHKAEYQSDEQVITIGEESTVTQNIVVAPYQYDVKAFVGKAHNNEKIIMHVYHVEGGIQVELESNFIHAFDAENKFKLTFANSDYISVPNKYYHELGEFDITFTSNGATEKSGMSVIASDITSIEIEKSEDLLHLDIFIPNSFYQFIGTFGVHLDSDGRGTFTPYEHSQHDTSAANEVCYVRVDTDDAIYSSSDNFNIFDLTWDTETNEDWIVTDVLGNVASKYNFGYQIKLAKNISTSTQTRHGLYIMTKYSQPQMSHFLPDGYQPHFFFDPVQLPASGVYPTRPVDSNIKHLAPISGYWMQSFTVQDRDHPFQNKQEYNQFFDGETINASPKVYAKDDFMITYIPYSFLNITGQEFTSNMTFGFACNLQYNYTGGEWHAWQGSNPSGYLAIPHFEETTSYIQFDSQLNIITYKAA
ncbi:MAG: Ig-like domain-containing protein [Mycoplasma sp.]|nr:Ig-like domain-containing protein [Candidatus Hennigella equi]